MSKLIAAIALTIISEVALSATSGQAKKPEPSPPVAIAQDVRSFYAAYWGYADYFKRPGK